MVVVVSFEFLLFFTVAIIFVTFALTIIFGFVTLLCSVLKLPIDYDDFDARPEPYLQ